MSQHLIFPKVFLRFDMSSHKMHSSKQKRFCIGSFDVSTIKNKLIKNLKYKNMEFVFEYHDVTASETLENFAKEKLNKLADKYQMVIRADVFFKKENTTSDETGMICNIRLSLPGPRLFAEASHGNFRDSISESVNDLERQLRKRKEKMARH